MFIGHFAVGLAAKKAAPKVSLGTLVFSVQLLDLLWPIFLILGIEHVRIDPGNTAFTPLDFYDYPISHSLLTVIGWGALLGIVYFAIRRYARGAWVLAAGVVSHWVLDAISHRPDMPLAPGVTAFVGLGLWNSVLASIIVEALLLFLGVSIYARITSAVDRKGQITFWTFVGFLVLFWLLNIFGPPPPDVRAIGWGRLSLWLFAPWGYWIDRHRKLRAGNKRIVV
jgi:hypothetical protein